MEIRVTGARINAEWAPAEDTIIVPDYDKVTWKITFYTDDTLSETVGEKTVNADTSYCLNDIPAVPAKEGYLGKWVYSGGDFSNNVVITEDTKVWAAYDQVVFNVTFKIEDSIYSTDTYSAGDDLELPSNPVVEGKDFVGWFIDDTQYVGGETVNSDLTLLAHFDDEYSVSFVILNDDGTVKETLSQYFRSSGEAIGTLPQKPFISVFIASLCCR